MSSITVHVNGGDAARLLSNMAQEYGNVRSLTVTVGESDSQPEGTPCGSGFLRVGVNGSNGVAYAATLAPNHTDAVARLRDLNAQYARGELTENPVQALREVMSLLDPAYDQLMRASG